LAKRGTGSRRGNREGSISKRRDGRWSARASLPGGGRKSYYGATRDEVASKLNDALKDLREQVDLGATSVTFAQFVTRWLRVAKPKLRESTHRRYEELLRLHALPRLGRMNLIAIGAGVLDDLYADRLAAGLSPTTVAQLHRVLHRALSKAVVWKAGGLRYNPATMAEAPKNQPPEKQVLDERQVRMLLAVTADDRLAAVYVLAAHSGMRQGEVLGLRWADVDLEGAPGTSTTKAIPPRLRVRASLAWVKRGERREWTLTAPKTKGSDRWIRLELPVVAALKRHRARQNEERMAFGEAWQDNGLVFTDEAGGPVVGTNFTRYEFAKALQRTGLPAITFHTLRHSAVSIMLSRGVPIPVIAKQLGHATPMVTLSVYAHMIHSDEDRGTSALAEAFRDPESGPVAAAG